MGDLRKNDLARIEIRNTLVDLLDGQRGFLLTNDEKYLEPYLRARQHIRQTLRQAAESGVADPYFASSVARLMLLTENKFEELDRTVLERKRGDLAGALAQVKSGYEKETMDRARSLIQSNLNLLRNARTTTMKEMDDRYLRSGVFLVLILSAVVVLAVQTWRSLSKASRHNTDLARRLAREASYDQLTDLPNRRFFDRWLRQLVARSHREGTQYTLMLIDLDGFKKVNDSYGHAVGDEVLRQAAIRFRSVVRDGEFLARLGGDEFGLLIQGRPPRGDLAQLGRRLINSLTLPLHTSVVERAVGASIGVAFSSEDSADVLSLTEAADRALYASKEHGRNMVSFAPTEQSVRTATTG